MFRTLTQLATAVALTAAITIAMPAWADESKAFAEAGRDASVALECAYYANEAGLQPEESARLMEYGYRQGQRFFAAMLAGKFSHDDLPSLKRRLV